MSYNSLEDIIKKCNGEKIDFATAILLDDIEDRKTTKEESMERMKGLWDAMLLASATYDRDQTSQSGLVGKAGAKMQDYIASNDTYSGDFVSRVICQALEMGESNACMKRIVAAPTAGSCGVLPAVLIPYFRDKKATTEEIVKALYTSAGIGQIIAKRAYIAGAAGGCQAEIGAASAMAAGTLVSLKGGSAETICNAAAMALKNLLGLVCDPVAGLVEVPCVKRNVVGAVNAVSCADMALAGITSVIPPDQVIDAMKEIGDMMPSCLKETGSGGVAASPFAENVVSSLNASH